MSIHNIEESAYQNESLDDIHYDTEKEEQEHCCIGCMKCLGLSWRDFM